MCKPMAEELYLYGPESNADVTHLPDSHWDHAGGNNQVVSQSVQRKQIYMCDVPL
jgi:hypothetical protein